MGRYSRSVSGSRSRSRSRSRGGGGDRDHSRDRRSEQSDDGYRVHVADLGVDCSQKELEKAFGKFGEFKEVWLAKNPPCFAFVVYKHKADAEEAIKEMDSRVVAGSRIRCSWARPRTRTRNSRFDPNLKCYQCGLRGHFSRDCRNSGGRASGGYRNRYNDDRRRDKYRRSRSRTRTRSRTRSRSRSRGRYRKASYSRSRSVSERRKSNGDTNRHSAENENV